MFINIALLALLTAACDGATPTPSTGRGFALDWYVETTGSDSNACDTSASPCATIRGAFAKMRASEGGLAIVTHTLYVGPGTYDDAMLRGVVDMTGTRSRFAANPVSVIGAGPDATILDARNSIGGVSINVEGNVHLSGFTVRNAIREGG